MIVRTIIAFHTESRFTILPEKILEEFLDFLGHVHDFFEEATKTTIKTYEDASTLLENSPYAVIVRKKVMQSLKDICSQYEFKIKKSEFNRIHLVFPKYEIRFMRLCDDSLVDGKRDFYQPFLFRELNTNKLILRWGVTSVGTFLGLELGMPRADSYRWPRLIWKRTVPPPTKKFLR